MKWSYIIYYYYKYQEGWEPANPDQYSINHY